MKRTLLSLLSILVLSTTLNAQETYLVANGTETNSYVPIYGLYTDAYIHSQTIYPSSILEELSDGGTILSLKWFLSSPTSSILNGTFQVRLGETNQESFSGSTWINSTDFTTVYTGNLNLTSTTCEITFTEPYTFEGGNLVVEIIETQDGNYSSCSFYGIEQAGGSVSGYDYDSWQDASGTVRNFIPKTEFTAIMGEITCRKPNNLTVQTISRTGAAISWDAPLTTDPDSYFVEYKLSSSSSWSGEEMRDPFIFLTGLSQASQYNVRVRSICGSDSSVAAQTTFTTPGCDVEIANGNTTVSQVPLYSTYEYGYSQMLYPASDLRRMDTINGIDFYLTGTISSPSTFDCYIANTSASSVSTSSYVPLSQLTRVVQNKQMTFTAGWNHIPFDTPFIYDGSSNIVIAVDNNTGSWTSGLSYSHHSSSGSSSCYWYRDYNDITPSSPEGSSGNYTSVPDIRFVTPCPSETCQAPLLLVNNVESHSVMLHWQPMGNATSWKVEYKQSADNTWTTANANVTERQYALNNLVAGTTYNFKVSANCSEANESTVSAFTQCDLFDLTYTENFATGSINQCWTISAYSPNYPSVVAGVLYTGPDNGSWVILPEFVEPVSNLMINFTAEHSATTGEVTIGVTTGQDISTFEEINTFEYTTDITEIEDFFDVYTGNGTNIALKFNDGYTNIDDIVVSVIPSCRKPTNIRIVELDATSATLTWDAGNNATGAIVKYHRIGARWNTIEVEGNTATLTDLVANNQYEVTVKAICGDGGNSDNSKTFTFRTGCADGSTRITERYPFIEDFENGLFCWQQEFVAQELEWVTQKGDGESNAGAHGIDTAYLGKYNAVFYNLLVYTAGPKTRIISPMLNTEALEDPWLRYAYGLTKYTDRETNQQYFDELTVFYRTSANGQWVQLKNYTAATTGWVKDSVRLPATSSTFQVSFLGYFKGGNGVALDDVRIYTAGHDIRIDEEPEGIEEAEATWTFRMYPNPTNGSTTIRLEGVEGKVHITLMDMSGRTVRTLDKECYGGCEHLVDLQGLAQGAYFVRVNGDRVNSVKKLIVR